MELALLDFGTAIAPLLGKEPKTLAVSAALEGRYETQPIPTIYILLCRSPHNLRHIPIQHESRKSAPPRR